MDKTGHKTAVNEVPQCDHSTIVIRLAVVEKIQSTDSKKMMTHKLVTRAKISQVALILMSLNTILCYQDVVVTVQGKLRGDYHKGYISYAGIPYASVSGADGKFKAGFVFFLTYNRDRIFEHKSLSNVNTTSIVKELQS